MKDLRKTIVLIILIVISCLLVVVAFSACRPKGDEPSQQEQPQEVSVYTLTYNTDIGGWLLGASTQTVKEGEDGSEVTAIAEYGYNFVGWSDGLPKAIRQDKEITSDLTVTAKFEKQSYKVTYSAGEGGSIQGKTEQEVKYGENAEEVTAVPDEGYKFIGWSDDIETAERQDLNVRRELTVEAHFEEISITLTYDYKLATDNCSEESITLKYFEIQGQKLIVPLREHFTFGGWYLGEEEISDENGNLLVGKEIFECEQSIISARWTANETFTFKILIVYVTEFYGDVPKVDGTGTISVSYKMPDIERKICQAVTIQMKRYLDDLLDGLVDFQVDEYFTTVPLGTDNLTRDPLGGGESEYVIFPYNIPEVNDILLNYDSVLSSYSFNDYEELLHRVSGSADKRFCQIHFESVLYGSILNNEPIDNLLDLNYWRWTSSIETYIHEMIHTIELRINTPSWHHTIATYHQKGITGNNLEIHKVYLLNSAEVDGEIVGIPYEFWKGDIANVIYWAEGRIDEHTYTKGYIVGETTQEVVYGWDTREVTAIPAIGYEFVEWSDGVKNPTRIDRNITGDFTVTALFKNIEYEIHYLASEGGTISGETVQKVKIRESGSMVIAVPDEGYVFIGWSDGVMTAERIDFLQISSFNGLTDFTVIALFKKID